MSEDKAVGDASAAQAAASPSAPVTVYVAQSPASVLFSDHPVALKCPSCAQQIVTQLRLVAGPMAWLVGLGLCFLGCCPCACAVCLFPVLRDVHHYCPSCGALVGVYKRL